MIKLLFVMVILLLGIFSGFYSIYNGVKKINDTGDNSFRFLNIFSNQSISNYSGKEQILMGIVILTCVGGMINFLFFRS